jgi:hypothetical protein
MKTHEEDCIECGTPFIMSDATKWPTFREQAEDHTGIRVRMEIKARRWYLEDGDDRIHTKHGGLCVDCLEKYFNFILKQMREEKIEPEPKEKSK